jgi:RNA polymerase sigma factor (sigma-70 family)
MLTGPDTRTQPGDPGLTGQVARLSHLAEAVAGCDRVQLPDRSVTDHAALLKSCAGGDRAALRALMRAEGGRMNGVARRMLRRPDLAEDAVQDALVLVWRRAHQYDAERGSARGWIYTILRNRCLTLLRSESREEATAPEVIDGAAERQTVDAAFDRLEVATDLRRCLAGLDEVTRRAIIASYVLGHSHGEIAGRMAAPLGSVKSWVRRGLLKLRECLS